jgi:hypothetical protein
MRAEVIPVSVSFGDVRQVIEEPDRLDGAPHSSPTHT